MWCECLWGCTCYDMHAMVPTWKSEDNFVEMVSPFLFCTHTGNSTRLPGKLLYPLSHLMGPQYNFWSLLCMEMSLFYLFHIFTRHSVLGWERFFFLSKQLVFALLSLRFRYGWELCHFLTPAVLKLKPFPLFFRKGLVYFLSFFPPLTLVFWTFMMYLKGGLFLMSGGRTEGSFVWSSRLVLGHVPLLGSSDNFSFPCLLRTTSQSDVGCPEFICTIVYACFSLD